MGEVLDLFPDDALPKGQPLSHPRDRCEIIVGDARQILAGFPEGAFQCVVTSPPYWGLRDYGVSGQIGAETSVHDYVADLVRVFREVRRVLSDGCLPELNSNPSTRNWQGDGY